MNYDVVYGLVLCIYIIVTVIMWRNIEMPLALAMSYGWYRLMRSFNPEPG